MDGIFFTTLFQMMKKIINILLLSVILCFATPCKAQEFKKHELKALQIYMELKNTKYEDRKRERMRKRCLRKWEWNFDRFHAGYKYKDGKIVKRNTGKQTAVGVWVVLMGLFI